jgi:hypothetical protein
MIHLGSVFFIFSSFVSFASKVSAAVPGCQFSGAQQISSSLWIEAPAGSLTMAQWTTYYQQLRTYLTSNCINSKISKVIIRTPTPSFGGTVMWPPKTSPLLTQLFNSLPAGIAVSVYPYLYADSDRATWKNFGGSSDIIENVYIFAKGWNDYLKSVGSAVRVSAITLDLGELIPGKVYQVPLTASKITAYKTKYGIPELGGLTSYDHKSEVLAYATVLDQFYLLISGLYYPYAGVDKSETASPFVIYKNNPVAMANFILTNIFLPGIKNAYLPYIAKMNALWSVESTYGDCIHPNSDGTCQTNYEFGVWKADAFNAFIRQIKTSSPDFFAKMQHGTFQYNFIPKTWVPSGALSVTPPTVTPTVAPTTAKPLTLTQGTGVSVKGCAVYGAATVTGFLWAETPDSVNSLSEFTTYFRKMRAYITNNCVNIQFTKLIIRIVTPSAYPGIFSNPKTSPLYTELISTLPSYVSINILPYVMTDKNRLQWVTYGGSRDVIENVFIYAANWNAFLKSVGNAVRFRGITLDYEEVAPSAAYSMAMSATSINRHKDNYGITEFGGAIGFDDRKKIAALTYYDEFYLEFYDFYVPYSNVDKSKTDSRFVVYKNNPVSMANYITSTIMQPGIVAGYAGHTSKLNAMWSLQSTLGGCIYPLKDGTCYTNYEFGIWRPDTVNAFIRQITSVSPLFKSMNHGLFQYNFTPKTWIPVS